MRIYRLPVYDSFISGAGSNLLYNVYDGLIFRFGAGSSAETQLVTTGDTLEEEKRRVGRGAFLPQSRQLVFVG
ncbi:MAG: hypothetical protein ACLS4Z_05285 [Christensenellaceae bacterium]